MESPQPVDWLLSCLSYSEHSSAISMLSTLTESDWRLLIDQALHHNVATLVYHRVQKTQIHIPESTYQTLRQLYLAQVGRNLRLYHNLSNLLKLLAVNAIPVIVLKGAYLAELVYQNIGLRGMVDIDILVHQSDLYRIEQVLVAAGYEPTEFTRLVWRENRHFQYSHPATKQIVEVHWTLSEASYPIRLDLAGLWARAQIVTLVQMPALVLSFEDLILHQCLHSAQHTQELNLSMLCDIGELVVNFGDQGNWNDLLLRARDWGISRVVYCLLVLSHELLQVPVPLDLIQHYQPADLDGRLSQIRKQILTKSTIQMPVSSLAADVFKSKNILNKTKRIIKILFPARKVMSIIYPVAANSWRVYPLYLVRLVDLVRRNGRVFFKLLKGDRGTESAVAQLSEVNELREWLLSG